MKSSTSALVLITSLILTDSFLFLAAVISECKHQHDFVCPDFNCHPVILKRFVFPQLHLHNQ